MTTKLSQYTRRCFRCGIMLSIILGIDIHHVAYASDLWQLSLEELMEIKISAATGTPKPLYLAPAVASIVDAQEIRSMGATTLEEALAMVPGLHSTPTSVKGMSTIFSIRGIHTVWNQQVLLTINGIPIRDPYSGSRPTAFRLPTSNISRIEVIRGPGSAVHGADAFSGVINVVTKTAEELGGIQAGGRLGSFDSQDAWLQYGGKLGDWNIALNVEHTRSQGDQSRRMSVDAATPLGTSLARRYPLQTQFNVWNSRAEISNDRWNISLAQWESAGRGIGPGIAQAIDPEGWNNLKLSQFNVAYKMPEKVAGWQLNSHLYYQRSTDDSKFLILPAGSIVPIGDDGNIGTAPNANCPNTGIPGLGKACLTTYLNGLYGNPGYSTRNSQIEIVGLYDAIKNHQIRLSVGTASYKMDSVWESKNFAPSSAAEKVGDIPATATIPNTNIPMWVVDGSLVHNENTTTAYILPQKRQAWFVSAQDEWSFGRDWTFTGGARYDKYSDFGSTFNPRAALVWAMKNNLTGKLLAGTAFRPPSFTEQSAINNPVTIGNPNLKPEKNHTIELAFDYRPTTKWRHNFNTYYYRADDLIGYDANHVAQNLRKQTGHGIELESRWQPVQGLQISAAYSWQRTDDKTNNAPVPNAPGSLFSSNINWQANCDWSIYGSVSRVMNRQRPVGDSRVQIPDYTWATLGARRIINRQLEMSAYVRNLFDTKARAPSLGSANYVAEDYPLEGRGGFVELRYMMGKKVQ